MTIRMAPRKVLFHSFVILCSFLMMYPVLWMLGNSFNPSEDMLQNMSPFPHGFTLANYSGGWTGFSGTTFGRFFLNSFVIAAASVAGNLVSSSLTAFAFARMEFPLKKVLFGVMLMTIMLPYHVVLIPQYILFKYLDWTNTFLPLTVPRFFATEPFFIYLMVQFMRGVPRELDQAATVDGCNRWQTYYRLILPLSVPALVTTTIFTFIFVWNDFLSPLIYLSDVKRFTASLGLSLFISNGDGPSFYGQLFAMSVISLVPLFAIFVFFQKYLVEGIVTTGLK